MGTYVVSSPGTKVTTSVYVGQPTPNTQAQPPADVLAACDWNNAGAIAQSVYIHGQVSVTYSGTIAEAISILAPGLTSLPDTLVGADTEPGGGVAIRSPDGNSWTSCDGNPENSWGYVLQPGTTTTAVFWIEYLVLSNTHPSFTSTDQQNLAIRFRATGADQGLGSQATATVSGPGAALCTAGGDRAPTLLLYSTPPYSFSSTINGNTLTDSCTPA